ncbi:hypothetical protein GGR57DRAFT_461604 [Xylariaceae sp. FL1272]|nr:hypothetical protein GGR57DRAFT_461604 [Xylariaceae sp. FL1272]
MPRQRQSIHIFQRQWRRNGNQFRNQTRSQNVKVIDLRSITSATMSTAALPSGTTAGMTPTEEATARSLILSIIYRYAALSRENGDFAPMAEIFEPGAVVKFGNGREFAPTDLGKVISNPPPTLLRHYITTVDIQFDSPDEARCESLLMVQSHLKAVDHWGRWTAIVRKQPDGRWLFREKTSFLDGFDPDGWVAQAIKAGF